MIKEFVPETRSDKKDAEIARLREQVRVLRVALGFYSNERNYEDISRDIRSGLIAEGSCYVTEDCGSVARHALAATEEK